MAIDYNSTAALLGAFGVLDRAKAVLLELFFPMEQVFETEEVYFDRVARARSLAPFVVPTVAGRPQRSRGYETHGYRPPYLKFKHIVEPIRALKRLAGERLLGGALTPRQRMDLSILDNMLIEDDAVTRRMEWMAASLLLSGSMVCAGTDHPAITIDIGRKASHTVVLTGALRWGQAGVDPLDNLNTWATTTASDSGFHPGTVIMDPLAAKAFTNGPGVTKIMNTYRQASGNIDLAGRPSGALGEEAQFLGVIGLFEVWQYQQFYADDTGAVQKLMPDNTVIMGNRKGCGGVRTQGAIIDADALLQALARFPKVWKSDDPSAWLTMMQSAPLPLLGWPNATFSATVA